MYNLQNIQLQKANKNLCNIRRILLHMSTFAKYFWCVVQLKDNFESFLQLLVWTF